MSVWQCPIVLMFLFTYQQPFFHDLHCVPIIKYFQPLAPAGSKGFNTIDFICRSCLQNWWVILAFMVYKTMRKRKMRFVTNQPANRPANCFTVVALQIRIPMVNCFFPKNNQWNWIPSTLMNCFFPWSHDECHSAWIPHQIPDACFQSAWWFLWDLPPSSLKRPCEAKCFVASGVTRGPLGCTPKRALGNYLDVTYVVDPWATTWIISSLSGVKHICKLCFTKR